MKTRIFLSLMLVICYVLSGIANANIKPNYANKIDLRNADISTANTLSKTNCLLLSIDNQLNNKNNWLGCLTYTKELLSEVKLFFVDEKIVYAEYFIDKDPGFGKGTSLPITASTSISNHNFTVALPATVSEGFHFITIRYKDALGRWSVSVARPFYKDKIEQSSSTLSNIVYAEYFLDKDPGFGKGSSIATTSGTEITNHTFAVVLPTSLEDGFHFVTVRYKDALGRWGVSSIRPFYKDKVTQGTVSSSIVYAEYFIDKDPGFGKGKSLTVKGGQTIENLNFDVNLNALGLSLGKHYIQLRAKDAKGVWGTAGTKTFVLTNEIVKMTTLPSVSCTLKKIDIPYIVEGVFGSNNVFTAELSDIDGVFQESPIQLGSITSTKNGTMKVDLPADLTGNNYKIRIVSTNPVRISDPKSLILKPTLPTVSVSNNLICQGASAILSATGCSGTVTWTGNSTGSSVTVTPTKSSNYKALCTVNGCKSDSSLATTITVLPKPAQPKITASNATICSGESSVLTSTACTGGTLTWTGGLTGSSITVSPTATKAYKVLCTISGCQSDSSLATTITVLPKPAQPKITASNTSICVGGSSVLTSTACTVGILTWTGGLTGNSITVSPTSTRNYKVLCTIGGCKSDSSLATTITVVQKPTQPKITASNTNICVGSSSVLTSTACTGGTLTWTGGLTGSSITVNPTATKSYKVLCTQSGCKSDSSLATTITVLPKPAQPKITASNGSICSGSSSVLTATACINGTLTWTGGLTGSSITVNPTATKSYKVLCTQSGCKSDSSLVTTITVLPKPVQPKITASNVTICSGSSSVITATACTGGTLTWTGGLTGSSITVSPTVTKTYKVLCTVNGCKSDSSLATTVTVISKPIQPKITVSNATICAGGSSVLTSTACTGGTLSWTGGLTGASIIVSPIKTTAYKVLCTIGGCKSDSSLATTITVVPKPTQPKITASNTNICVGSSSVLTSTACTGGTLTWTGGLTGSSITVSPTKTSAYKVLCSINGCKSDSSLATTITVLSKPAQPKITVSNGSICSGSSSILTATACIGGTLTWTSGLTGSSIIVSPIKTTAYKVLCTIGGCKSDSSLATTVTVISKPTQPKITVSNATICAGGSSVLTSTACTGGTLSWTGGLTGSSITVSPTKTSAYKVLCTIGGCKSDSSLATTITVVPKPTQPKITASNTNICVGSSSVLTSTACTGGTLTWTGGLTGSSITVSPTVTKFYKVLCSISGCKSDSSLATTVTVISKPVQPKITASNSNICAGGSSILTALACTGGKLTWTGVLTGNSITVSPTKTTAFKVLCTIGSCKSDSSLETTITVISKPTQPKITTSNASICAGGSSVLTSSACTGGTLTWTGGLTGSSITVSPTVTKTYKVLCTANGCKSDSSLATTVTVISKPTQPKITANNTSICSGSSSVLTATACIGGTLTWTSGLTGSSITVSPTKTSAYKVLCTIGGCKSDSSLATTITVVPKPTQPKITASNTNICVGSSSVLTSTACTGGTLTWTGGLTGSSITVSPTITKFYKVLCSISGCKSDSSLATTVTVISKPVQPKITASNSNICAGGSSILTALACTGGKLTWTGVLTGNSITVSPTKTTAYKVLCTIGSCQSDSSLATTITVLSKPSQPKITISNASICAGGSSVLTSSASTGGILTWTGGLTGSSITVSPTVTKTYKVLCTVNGCKSDSSLATTITILPKPNVSIIANSNNTCPNPILTKWDKTFGGNKNDELRVIVPTSDGGFLLGGSSKSDKSGDKSEYSKENSSDYWLVKIDANGTKIWDKTLGGNQEDVLSSIIQTPDGGYLLGGYSKSGISGDKSEANNRITSYDPYFDYWIVKINGNGTKVWDKTFGGSGDDRLVNIVSTPDGGYFLAGYSDSRISGDKSIDSRGGYDYWIIKVNANGMKLWDKTLGGTNHDNLSSIVSTRDGGYILGGYSYSNISGEKSESSKGNSDYWIVKVNENGTKIWDKTIGGNTIDELVSIIPTPDGGYLIGGSSNSGISGDKSEAYRNLGYYDYWIVKINASGSKIWDKTFGGSNHEYIKSVVSTSDGGYLLMGSSLSGINGDKSEANKVSRYSDYWIVKVSSNGTKIWDKTVGGKNDDVVTCIASSIEGGYLIGGSSFSGIGNDKSEESKGETDFWILKAQICIPTTTLTATGCTGTVTWSNGSTGNSITVSPSTATTYTATCTVNGCVSSASNAIKVSPDLTTTSTSSMYEAARLDANPSKSDSRIEFKVFPNPATDELNVETGLEGEATFQLYNIIGQQVLEKTFIKQIKIPLDGFSKGAYYYLIQYQEYRKTGKVLLE